MASDRTNLGDASQANPSGSETLNTKAQETAAEFREQANETRQEVRDRAEGLGAQAQEMASEYYQQGREKALAWERVLEDRIREKPIQSLLVAGGIGLLLGLLWRR
jgi:ElaB/YqjD/DUF883 family membrane-anchored ribosome-binding protein